MLKSCFGICLVMAFVLFLVGCSDTGNGTTTGATSDTANSTSDTAKCAGYSVSNTYYTDGMQIEFAHPSDYMDGYKDWVCIDDPKAPSTTTYQVCVLQDSWLCYTPAFYMQSFEVYGVTGTSFGLAVFRNGNWPAEPEAGQIQAQVQLKS